MTRRSRGKLLSQVAALPGAGALQVEGYEIHTGRIASGRSPLFELDCGEHDGTASEDGTVLGTHLHGLFDNRGVIEAVSRLTGAEPHRDPDSEAEAFLDELAEVIECSLDMEMVERLVGFR